MGVERLRLPAGARLDDPVRVPGRRHRRRARARGAVHHRVHDAVRAHRRSAHLGLGRSALPAPCPRAHRRRRACRMEDPDELHPCPAGGRRHRRPRRDHRRARPADPPGDPDRRRRVLRCVRPRRRRDRRRCGRGAHRPGVQRVGAGARDARDRGRGAAAREPRAAPVPDRYRSEGAPARGRPRGDRGHDDRRGRRRVLRRAVHRHRQRDGRGAANWRPGDPEPMSATVPKRERSGPAARLLARAQARERRADHGGVQS